eukprot:scaffold16068_cov113-Isochrysis_galbana.AAC.1
MMVVSIKLHNTGCSFPRPPQAPAVLQQRAHNSQLEVSHSSELREARQHDGQAQPEDRPSPSLGYPRMPRLGRVRIGGAHSLIMVVSAVQAGGLPCS